VSETVRSYSRPGAVTRRRGHGRRRASGALLLILATLFLWVLWTTRDTHAMGGLIPEGQDYQIYMSDFLNKRAQIAESRLWVLVPEDTTLAEVPRMLRDNFGMPEWVLNNLIYGLCHVSGSDLQEFDDLLFVTRMTRVGTLIERFHRFLPGIEKDFAGGLRVRIIPEAGLYYAVRGRVLAVSPSRSALIRALTLTPDTALGNQALAAGLAELGIEDLSAQLELQEEDPLGGYFEELQVAMRLEETAGALVCRGRLRESQRAHLAPLLAQATPRTLQAPPEGLAGISADFGRPLPELWAALGGIWESTTGEQPALFTWAEDAEGDMAALGEMLRLVLGATGASWRLSWHGVDLHEMLPVPELVGRFQADARILEPLFASVPAATAGAPHDAVLRRHPETGLVSLPLLGGPSIEPSAALHGGELLLSTSRTVAEAALTAPSAGTTLSERGNLYIHIDPYAATRAVVNAGMEFAAFGAVRGHTQESFTEAAAGWLETASKMEAVTLLAAHSNGEVRLDLQVRVRAEAPEAVE